MTLYLASVSAGKANFIPDIHRSTVKIFTTRFVSLPKHDVVFRKIEAAGTAVKPVSASTAYRIVGPLQPSLSYTALDLQARLRAKWPAVMARARELEKTNPDPVQSMIELLGNLPGDYATWREILEEPYG
ncbi:MAG: hypothetical protein HY258_04050 [Chloroflexi bacterium]|nr:hypothetical protein [Chloroflexota bacterium]